MYLFLLFTGALGFLVMTAFGLAHGVSAGHHFGLGGHGSSGGHAPLGHGTAGHAPAIHHNGSAHPSHAGGHSQIAHHGPQAAQQRVNHGQGRDAGSESAGAWKLLLAISPLDIFTLMAGGGAAGMILAPYVSASTLVWWAVAGALVFDFGIVKPFMGFMMRFVSRPSEGLEGQVSQVAEAVTAFDRDGKGVVRVCLDGQYSQLLANLESSERQRDVHVNKGDQVLVVEVDAGRNTCLVSRELAPSLEDAATLKNQPTT